VWKATVRAVLFLSIAALYGPAAGQAASGPFDRTWGNDVVSAGPGNTGTGFEICVPANGDSCQAGISGGLGGEMNLPRGVATDTAGNVYVADVVNHRVQKFDSAGNFLRAWGRDVVSAGLDNTGTGFEICVAANGDTCKIGTQGGLGGEVSWPFDVDTDAAGNVYLADAANHRIQKFDSAGNFLRAWGQDVVSAGPGNTGTGFEICMAANGDTCQAGPDPPTGALGGAMNAPRGVDTDAVGRVYVTDTDNNRVQKFDSAGNFLRAWGKDVVSAGPGNIGTGFEICVAANGDTCKIGTIGGLAGEMYAVAGIATDAADDVYISDHSNQRFQKFNSAGNFLRAWGMDVVSAGPDNTGTGFEICVAANADTCKAGSISGAAGGTNYPHDIATDSAGNLYATDEVNNRIQKFSDSAPWAVLTQPPTTALTGQRAAAVKRCKKIKKNKNRKKRKKCLRRARKLPP
jgi:tripartite motif-containing protein 71